MSTQPKEKQTKRQSLGAAFALGAHTGHGKLSLSLQESGIGIDELLSVNVANRDSRHFGGGGWRLSLG